MCKQSYHTYICYIFALLFSVALGATPGIFWVCVFFKYSNSIFYKTLFSAEAILFPGYTYSSGRKHALRKNGIPREPNLYMVRLISWINAYIHPYRFVQMRDQFDPFFRLKKASEKSAKNITQPSIGQRQKRTSCRANNVVYH